MSKPATWASYNGVSATTYGSGGISSIVKLGTGRYAFFFTASKTNYVVSGSSAYNSVGYNTWICSVYKTATYIEVDTCDTIPSLTFVDTPSLDVLVMDF